MAVVWTVLVLEVSVTLVSILGYGLWMLLSLSLTF